MAKTTSGWEKADLKEALDDFCQDTSTLEELSDVSDDQHPIHNTIITGINSLQGNYPSKEPYKELITEPEVFDPDGPRPDPAEYHLTPKGLEFYKYACEEIEDVAKTKYSNNQDISPETIKNNMNGALKEFEDDVEKGESSSPNDPIAADSNMKTPSDSTGTPANFLLYNPKDKLATIKTNVNNGKYDSETLQEIFEDKLSQWAEKGLNNKQFTKAQNLFIRIIEKDPDHKEDYKNIFEKARDNNTHDYIDSATLKKIDNVLNKDQNTVAKPYDSQNAADVDAEGQNPADDATKDQKTAIPEEEDNPEAKKSNVEPGKDVDLGAAGEPSSPEIGIPEEPINDSKSFIDDLKDYFNHDGVNLSNDKFEPVADALKSCIDIESSRQGKQGAEAISPADFIKEHKDEINDVAQRLGMIEKYKDPKNDVPFEIRKVQVFAKAYEKNPDSPKDWADKHPEELKVFIAEQDIYKINDYADKKSAGIDHKKAENIIALNNEAQEIKEHLPDIISAIEKANGSSDAKYSVKALCDLMMDEKMPSKSKEAILANVVKIYDQNTAASDKKLYAELARDYAICGTQPEMHIWARFDAVRVCHILNIEYNGYIPPGAKMSKSVSGNIPTDLQVTSFLRPLLLLPLAFGDMLIYDLIEPLKEEFGFKWGKNDTNKSEKFETEKQKELWTDIKHDVSKYQGEGEPVSAPTTTERIKELWEKLKPGGYQDPDSKDSVSAENNKKDYEKPGPDNADNTPDDTGVEHFAKQSEEPLDPAAKTDPNSDGTEKKASNTVPENGKAEQGVEVPENAAEKKPPVDKTPVSADQSPIQEAAKPEAAKPEEAKTETGTDAAEKKEGRQDLSAWGLFTSIGKGFTNVANGISAKVSDIINDIKKENKDCTVTINDVEVKVHDIAKSEMKITKDEQGNLQLEVSGKINGKAPSVEASINGKMIDTKEIQAEIKNDSEIKIAAVIENAKEDSSPEEIKQDDTGAQTAKDETPDDNVANDIGETIETQTDGADADTLKGKGIDHGDDDDDVG